MGTNLNFFFKKTRVTLLPVNPTYLQDESRTVTLVATIEHTTYVTIVEDAFPILLFNV